MATSWIIPTGQDLLKVLSHLVSTSANQNIGSGSAENDPLDLTQQNRRDDLVTMAVAEVRGAIQAAERFPLSVTANAVPRVAVPHTLYLAAWRLISSTPNLPLVVINEEAVAKTFYEDAKLFLKSLREGKSFDLPSDPTGQDYLTAVSSDNPAINGIRYGDLYGEDADYEAGYVVTSTGAVITLPQDDMTTY